MKRGSEEQPLSPRDLGFDPEDIERSMGPYIQALGEENYDSGLTIPVVHVPEHQIPGVEPVPEGTPMVMARAASAGALGAARARAIGEFGIKAEEPRNKS